MEQPIILDDSIAVDDNPVSDQAIAGTEMDMAFPPFIRTEEFKRQEEWINAIAFCPFLSPDHLWKAGNIRLCIGFIPAEPEIWDE